MKTIPLSHLSPSELSKLKGKKVVCNVHSYTTLICGGIYEVDFIDLNTWNIFLTIDRRSRNLFNFSLVIEPKYSGFAKFIRGLSK